MATKLLDSLPHYCFHSPMCNVHKHPDLHVCDTEGCPSSITPIMAEKAGLVDDSGGVTCPTCEGTTTLKVGEKVAEIHAKLCMDETIHYPEKHAAGEIDDAQYANWKSTLTRDELLGYYKRVPDVHITATFNHEETSLMETDLPAFNQLVQTRMKEKAELALLHQVPYLHTTTKHVVKL